MARAEAVKLVEKAIADFRDHLKLPSVATAVAGLLNLFTEHAWSEAVMRSDSLHKVRNKRCISPESVLKC